MWLKSKMIRIHGMVFIETFVQKNLRLFREQTYKYIKVHNSFLTAVACPVLILCSQQNAAAHYTSQLTCYSAVFCLMSILENVESSVQRAEKVEIYFPISHFLYTDWMPMSTLTSARTFSTLFNCNLYWKSRNRYDDCLDSPLDRWRHKILGPINKRQASMYDCHQ